MIIINAKVYGADETFHDGEITIKDGVITDVVLDDYPVARKLANDQRVDEDIVDASGCYAIPGLLDLHFHGAMGADFCDGTQEAIQTIAKYEAHEGVTAICPATLTLSVDELKHVLAEGAAYAKSDRPVDEADLVGVNMEGPFISKVKKGAQNENFIIPCDVEIVDEFIRSSEGLLKIIGLAPEDNPNFEEYIEAVKDKVTVSLAHTNADYETAMKAFKAGAKHAVHLYNAMSGMTHRAPGVIGAVSDSPSVNAEIICDGNHVHPAMVRAAFRLVGADRMILISDSLRAAGCGDGLIDLGGQQVIVEGTKATLVEGGNLAGSVTNLADCMRIAVQKMGIELETAIACATIHPAKAIGVDDRYGSLEAGKKGNVVLLDMVDLETRGVVKDGVVIR